MVRVHLIILLCLDIYRLWSRMKQSVIGGDLPLFVFEGCINKLLPAADGEQKIKNRIF